jgi:hypothetical protein
MMAAVKQERRGSREGKVSLLFWDAWSSAIRRGAGA